MIGSGQGAIAGRSLRPSPGAATRMIAASAAKKTSIAPDPGAAETEVTNPSGPLGPVGAGLRDESALAVCGVRSAREARSADGQSELGSIAAVASRPGPVATAPTSRDAERRGPPAATSAGVTAQGTLVEAGGAAASSLGGLAAPVVGVGAVAGAEGLDVSLGRGLEKRGCRLEGRAGCIEQRSRSLQEWHRQAARRRR